MNVSKMWPLGDSSKGASFRSNVVAAHEVIGSSGTKHTLGTFLRHMYKQKKLETFTQDDASTWVKVRTSSSTGGGGGGAGGGGCRKRGRGGSAATAADTESEGKYEESGRTKRSRKRPSRYDDTIS